MQKKKERTPCEIRQFAVVGRLLAPEREREYVCVWNGRMRVKGKGGKRTSVSRISSPSVPLLLTLVEDRDPVRDERVGHRVCDQRLVRDEGREAGLVVV